jgi:hypothetical protein
VSGWTTIPPWLYQNDLPDDELQHVYVRAVQAKAAELRRRVRALERELAEERQALANAEEFLAGAEAALRRYRKRLPRG